MKSIDRVTKDIGDVGLNTFCPSAIGRICTILDEHAEAIEQLKSMLEVKEVADRNGHSIDFEIKPKSLTLDEIEAVIDECCTDFGCKFAEDVDLKQAFRDKLK